MISVQYDNIKCGLSKRGWFVLGADANYPTKLMIIWILTPSFDASKWFG